MEHIQNIIIGFGYLGVGGAVFAESGLFFAAFLPGDSLLFTVGLLSSQGYFHILILWCIIIGAAIFGDNIGYTFGKMVGSKIFNKKESLFFRQAHVTSAKDFYDRYGKKAIVLARFVPVVRTFAPIIAGVVKMNYRTFLTYNIIGGFLWGTLILGAGFSIGRLIPGAGKYLEYIILGIIFISVLPIIFEYVRAKRVRKVE